MGPPNIYIEARFVPHSIDGKWVVRIREGVNLTQWLGVAFANQWMIESIQLLSFKTLPGRSRVLALVCQMWNSKDVSIEMMMSLRRVPVSLLVWRCVYNL